MDNVSFSTLTLKAVQGYGFSGSALRAIKTTFCSLEGKAATSSTLFCGDGSEGFGSVRLLTLPILRRESWLATFSAIPQAAPQPAFYSTGIRVGCSRAISARRDRPRAA